MVATQARKRGLRHQCLSAGSLVRTPVESVVPVSEGSVTNAFRLGVWLGP